MRSEPSWKSTRPSPRLPAGITRLSRVESVSGSIADLLFSIVPSNTGAATLRLPKMPVIQLKVSTSGGMRTPIAASLRIGYRRARNRVDAAECGRPDLPNLERLPATVWPAARAAATPFFDHR